MNKVIAIIIAIIALAGGYTLLFRQTPASDSKTDTMEYPVLIDPISHATMILTWGDVVLYTDPVGDIDAFAGKTEPDIVLVTDTHGDHLDADTLRGVLAEKTTIIAPQAVLNELPEALASRAKMLANGERLTEREISIEAIPMYNLPESADAYHVKGRGNGYVLEKDGYRVYIAGDTSGIWEMRALKDIDLAFVPMNLPYTMDIEEAADAVLEFAPKKISPYHYQGQDGFSDVQRFKDIVESENSKIEVLLLPWYPDVN